MFKTSTLKFVYFQNFLEKQKCVYLRPKVPDWGIFGLHFKKLLSYLKSTPSYLSICNVSKKKCVNFGPKVLWLGIFGLKF